MNSILLIAALVAQVPGYPTFSQNENDRLRSFDVPEVRTLTNGTGCTVATGSVSVAFGALAPTANQSTAGAVGAVVWTAGDTVLTMSTTTSPALAPMAYAGRVNIAIFDQAANSTPTCTGGIEIVGTTMRNQLVSERITSALTEGGTGVFSANVYKGLTRVRLFGCSSFNTLDEAQVRMGPWVGIPTQRLETGDLEAMAAANGGQPARHVRGSALTVVNTPTGPAVNVLSVPLANITPNYCVPDASVVAFRYRAR
jgi:hypothetical protein